MQCFFCQQLLADDASVCPQCQQPQVLRGVYRLTGLLGQGGFGTVYRASDVRFKRDYAIKMIYAPSAAEQRQLQTEAAILAQAGRSLSCVPEIYDAWSEGNRTVLVMEFVPGLTLDALVTRDGPLDAAQSHALLHTLLEHLAQLHAASIIHRDIKPENITQRPDGSIMLLDFGISKHQSATLPAAKALSPFFSSPEQMRGQPTDERSDLYSLGATLVFMLSGETPPPALLRLQAPTLSMDYGASDAATRRVLTRLLELEPARRPASAEAALALLSEPVLPGKPALPAAARRISPRPAPWPGSYASLPPLPPVRYRPDEDLFDLRADAHFDPSTETKILRWSLFVIVLVVYCIMQLAM